TTASNLTLTGATLRYTGPTGSTNRNFVLSGATTGTIEITQPDASLTISGASTSTTGALTKLGPGALVLSGANLYSGATTISAGTLGYGVANALGAGDVAVEDGGTYDLNGFSDTIDGLVVNSGATGGTVTTGAGTLTLGSNVSSTGGATNASISGNLALGGSTRTFTVTNAADGLDVSAVISGTVGLTKAGAGTLTLSGDNTYTGATTVNTGIVSVASLADGGTASNIGASTTTASNLTLGGGTLQYTGPSAGTDRNFVLSGGTTSSLEVTGAGSTLSISGASTSTSGALVKRGSGTLTFSGSNLHTGSTTVTAGTLLVNGTQSSSAVSLNGGTLGGTGTVASVTSTASGGTVAPGAGPGILNSGGVNWSSGSPVFQVELNGTTAGADYDQLIVTGTVNLTGSSFSGTVGYSPTAGQTFTIVSNDGSDAVTGTFAGLAQGVGLAIGGFNFTISYTGGTGNDVVLTCTGTPVIAADASVAPPGAQPPGTDLTYATAFTNSGSGSAQSIVVTDSLPGYADFKVGSVTSDLGSTGLTVVVSYSDDGGGTWTYVPASGNGGAPSGYDRLVTHIRWIFTGSLSQTPPANSGSVGFTARIR
ncbi:MAG TPA: autotransporter-associated beta strand repeat-containing protein, partial [Gemmatimonadales bacterium]|nr:autotransporter-associated beta strand repeat-containing protein [Gemmatimonadales bacterium]